MSDFSVGVDEMRIVFKIGGSVIASPLDAERIVQYSKALRSVKDKGHEVVVVVGGGKVAREFISIAEGIGLSDNDKDEIAILVSRLNARLLAGALGKYGSGNIPSTTEEVSTLLAAGKIAVMGGLRPGITTDTVAAIVLESVKSKFLVKATDQEGIYNKDPRKNPDARKIDRLTYSDLHKIVSQKAHMPGMHDILDPESIRILESQSAKVIVVSGLKPENLLAAVSGAKIGTVVESG
ncbi:MAG: UMP kinase [Promethearchaeati archaeon SRVP18_Atabeyarchaeia-1]